VPSPTKVILSAQVVHYQRAQHPQARRAIKVALGGLATGKGDIKTLEDDLDGYHRLAVGPHRVIFEIGPDGTIRCLFAERRKVVYEIFSAQMREFLG